MWMFHREEVRAKILKRNTGELIMLENEKEAEKKIERGMRKDDMEK